MTPDLDVGCPCGSTTLGLSEAPAEQCYCHCQDCRTALAAPYVAVALYPREAVRCCGEPALDAPHYAAVVLPRLRRLSLRRCSGIGSAGRERQSSARRRIQVVQISGL